MRKWYCVYTKPRQSDLVYRRLSELPQIDVLNPKLKRKKFLRGRWVDILEDLFPCYIFVKLDINRYYRVVKYTRGVRRFVGDSKGFPYEVDSHIIDSITRRMKNGIVKLEPCKLNPGESVLINDGPLAGFEAIFLEELKPKDRVLILLNTIQYRAKVEIDRSLLIKNTLI